MASASNISAQETAEKSSATMHASDRCADTLNIKIESVGPGQAVVSMIVNQAYANGHGFCQGGIITTLADTAFAHACNSYNRMSVAQGLSIEFVRSAKVGERLVATATEKSRGSLTGVYLIEVRNQAHKVVAIMTGKSFARNETIFED